MTTNKPEVFGFHCHGQSAPAYSCNKPADNSGEYVRLSDYEALEAECERLREALLEAQATMTSALSFDPAINEVTKMTLRAEVERIKSLLSEGGNKS